MKAFSVLALCLTFVYVTAQPVLLPHIGLTSLPNDAASVCNIPVYQGNFNTSGYAVGDTVNDFTLYNRTNISVRLRDLLVTGKPVLLVGGNYTCPVFRGKINDMNSMAAYYSGQIHIYVVYGVEAHPIVDVSPYSGNIWTTNSNQQEGVLFQQPKTYGERKTVIDSMLAHYTIVPDILIDGPCNEWWLNFGPAPNNAYLINPNGTVAAKHDWFHRTPLNMWCDIDFFLGTTSGNCINAGNNGNFIVTLDDEDSIVYGIPGEVLAIHSTITNLSTTENVELRISKQSIIIPGDWETALCADVCYLSTVIQADITIAPSSTQPFIFYFYAGATADTGRARIRFANRNVQGNVMDARYMGITLPAVNVSHAELEVLQIYPNPVAALLNVVSPQKCDFRLIDMKGKAVREGILVKGVNYITLESVTPGIYFLQSHSAFATETKRVVVY